MAYQINKTDGSILSTVADGQVDNLSTDITLIGKNYSGFGEALNENFVKMLENFASTSRPERPIRGQIWFDSSELKLKVYTGSTFVPVSSANIASSQPTTLGAGDLWFNDVDRQLYFFDGSETILLGPAYSESQGLSGFRVLSILDTLNQTRVITQLWTNGILLGIFSKDRFQIKTAITGYGESGKFIYPGFNKGNYELRVSNPTTGELEIIPIKFDVTVTNSEQLGGSLATAYVRRDTANSLAGQLRVEVDQGILIGTGNQAEFSVNNGDINIANNASNKQILISARNFNDQEIAIRIDPLSRRISLYDGIASSEVLVGGNLVVDGNLQINGTTTTLDTSVLTVEDKNIELAKQSDQTPTDENASGGGIILRGLTPHVLLWSKTTEEATIDLPALAGGAWTSSDNFNLAQNKWYGIDNVPLIEQISTTPGDKRFRLTNAVTQIAGVSSFGKQIAVNVGPGDLLDPAFMRLEDNRISTLLTDQDLELEPNGAGNIVLIGNPKITGLSDPTSAQDASTKEYVDNKVENRSIVLSMDLSDGKPNSYISNNILPLIAPISEYRNGTRARILCTIINNSSVSVAINPLISLSTTTFSTPSGTAPGVTNVSISNATVPGASVSTSRIVKEFQLISGIWTFISDTILPP